jgi:hypothetical protein
MEGTDLSYTTDIGDLSATLQLAYGRSTSEDYDVKGIVGTTGTLKADTWNTKVSYSVANDITVTDEDIQDATTKPDKTNMLTISIDTVF